MKKLIITSLLISLSLPVYAFCVLNKPGTELYLYRSNTETHRAVFVYPSDCELIAKTMAKVEPDVSWYCK